ncbi:hypothetical protein ACKC5O_00545 [Aeromonas schubertii]|uniref:hypothetical protein n=1 Tax=Aeromonas schubertii TaxID=652 RepID=UPI0038B430DE
MRELGRIISTATENITKNYFQLTLQGQNTVIFRERVYCYELYHQMRCNWPENGYKICGEIDKRGHPILRNTRESPDFLVHTPGEDGNYAIIEVKPANFSRAGLIKDFITITNFMGNNGANYERGICLIYGDTQRLINKINNAVLHFANNGGDASSIEIWHHPVVGERARHISILGTKAVTDNNQ